jgi:DNA polymerase Pol2
MRLYVLDADSIEEDGQSVIRLFCKDEKGDTVVCLDYDFRPYFYVLPQKGRTKQLKKKLENLQSVKVDKVEAAEKIVDGEKAKLLKVSCLLSSDVTKARDIVKAWKDDVQQEYEYSINFYRRYLIDKQTDGWIEIEGEPMRRKYRAKKVLKVKSLKPIKSNVLPKLKSMSFKAEAMDNKIIMISLMMQDFEKVLTYQNGKYSKQVEVLKDEKALLGRFVEIVNEKDPDVLLGFNSDKLDAQIIQKRSQELKVDIDLSRDCSNLKFSRRARVSTARFKGVVHIDLYQFVNNVLGSQIQTELLNLSSVSAELLRNSDIETKYEDLLETLRKKKDSASLANYSLNDCDMLLRLGNFVLPQIYEMSELCGQLLFDISRMTYSQLVEWYLSKRAYAMDNIIPNQPKWEEIERRRAFSPYIGGFVKEPIAGLHDDIAVMDFRSLYPSIIATFNISPETFNCQDCKKNGYKVPERNYWFCKKRKGFVSVVIQELMDRRLKIKSLMKDSKDYNRLNNEQLAVKTVTNAMYGYLNFAQSKWYCRECADSSAAFGRFYIKKVIKEAEKDGFTVVYGDTDSLFVTTKVNTDKKMQAFLKKVNDELPGKIKLDLQGIYRRGLFISKGAGAAKKRYALLDGKGNLTIKGLEVVRSDWSRVAKDAQKAALGMILGKNDIKGSIKHVKNVIESLRNGKISLKDLVIIEQLSKPLSEYKINSPHIAAARKILDRGRPLREEMPILFVITKGKGSISERAEPLEDASIKDVDVDYYISHQIVPAALRVLAVLGVKEEDIIGS